MDEQYAYSLAIVALIVSDLLLVWLGALFCKLRSRRISAGDSERALTTSEMRNAVATLSASLTSLNERLARIDTHVSRLSEHDEQRRAAAKDSSRKPFDVATKLALRGAEVEDLVSLCGLTRGEAELIRMVHTNRSALP